MFVIDPKGENAWVTAPHRRAMGQRVVILDPWDETNRYGRVKGVEKPTKFNPLSFLNRHSRSYSDDVGAVAGGLIITAPGDNPHFPGSAREFVAGLIALAKEAYGDKATLRHVRNFITSDIQKIRDLTNRVEANVLKEFASGKGKQRASLAARKLRRFILAEGGSEEVNGVMATAITQTAFLDSEDLLDAMETDADEFRLPAFLSRPTTIFVVLPASKLFTHSRWLRMITSMTLDIISRSRTTPSPPILMLIDEMGTIGALEPLRTAFSLLRGYEVRVFGFFQSLGQLKGDYPDNWENFINNCSILQLLAARDSETAQYFSTLLGTCTVPIGDPKARQETSRPLMFPQELAAQLGRHPKKLEQNVQLVMLLQGAHYARMLQNPYFREPRWNGRYRSPPGKKQQLASTTQPPQNRVWERITDWVKGV